MQKIVGSWISVKWLTPELDIITREILLNAEKFTKYWKIEGID
jgi:hypothetical protein